MHPQVAANGASSKLTLSPTPPVLCLSTLGPGRLERSKRAPDSAIDWVSVAVSVLVRPRHMTAIRNEDIW